MEWVAAGDALAGAASLGAAVGAESGDGAENEGRGCEGVEESVGDECVPDWSDGKAAGDEAVDGSEAGEVAP